MEERPEGFYISYSWREGSLPPPYHYEYSIYLGPRSEGEIAFYPDYPNEEPPVWREYFSIDDKALDELYGLIKGRELFTKQWTEIDDPLVGSSLEWMEVIAGEKHLMVPSAINESQVVNDIYNIIKSVVPIQVWSKLMDQYEQYQRNYLENGGNSQG